MMRNGNVLSQRYWLVQTPIEILASPRVTIVERQVLNLSTFFSEDTASASGSSESTVKSEPDPTEPTVKSEPGPTEASAKFELESTEATFKSEPSPVFSEAAIFGFDCDSELSSAPSSTSVSFSPRATFHHSHARKKCLNRPKDRRREVVAPADAPLYLRFISLRCIFDSF